MNNFIFHIVDGFLAAQRLSLADCGLARLDTLTRAFASKVWLKNGRVASRLERFVGRLLRIETNFKWKSDSTILWN
jgi:hypothetical protein